MAVERPPSVLMTADTVGGVWTYAVELSRALERCGLHVHLATLGAPLSAHQRRQLAGMTGLTLHESSFKLEWMPDPWDEVDQAGEWLLALADGLQPELVHLNQFAFGNLPFAAPTLLVAHSCVASWWQAVHATPAPAAWDTYRRRVAAGLAGASLVAAPTRAMLETLAANHGHAGPTLVLPNGRDADLLRPGTKAPVILAAGRLWDEAKNIAALEAVAADIPWPIRVAGSCIGPDGQVRAPRRVQALGELPATALAAEMAAASIYALPARYEPFGLSILEAALCGCALVLGDIPSLREIWGASATFVPPDDHAALQQALRRLIDQPAERRRLGQAARRRALDFTPEVMGQAVLAAYARIQPRLARAPAKELTCA